MNQKIKELAEQAGIIYVYLLSPSYPDPVIRATPESIEKFLNLIVEECASICHRSNFRDADAHAQNLLYEFNIGNCREWK